MENIYTKLKIVSTEEIAFLHSNPQAIRLDVGCGSNKRHDTGYFVGIDKFSYPGVDIVRDIEKEGMPFCDNCIDFIYTSHCLEHIDNLLFVMDEFWRILKKNGILEIIVPYWNTAQGLGSPDHKRLFHEEIWLFWRVPKGENYQSDREGYKVKATFQILRNLKMGEGLFTTMRAVK